jgi:hydrogenase nickel incorporation protein HypA/HybF
MHEWALADAVLTSVLDALPGRDARRIHRVRLQIGELQAVDREIFLFGLGTLLEPYGVPVERFVVETRPAELSCGACGNRWGLGQGSGLSEEEREAIHFLPEAAHAFVRCPRCGSPDFSVEEGRGVSIAGIEIVDTSDPEGPPS